MLAKLKKIFVWTLGTVVAVLFLSFAMLNDERVTLYFAPLPVPEMEVQLFLFIGILTIFGTLLGWFVASFECRRRYLVKKELRHRIKALEDEVAALRARHHLPAHHPHGDDHSLPSGHSTALQE